MKFWIPIAVGSVIAFAYAFFYLITSAAGAASFGVTNSIGLVVVFVGLIAAGFILRRANPPQ